MAGCIQNYVEHSQVELSERTGLSQTSISQIESGAKNPSKKSVKKICEAFEIPEAILYVMGMKDADVPVPRKGVFKDLYPAMKDFAIQMIGRRKSRILQ
ncbi:MAG: helix-turn-helix transcriptional regulator [Chitinophagaceae bacterium]|nr:helix-turn-helix transcriptional regulator [Chitinophagaceae bacterium]